MKKNIYNQPSVNITDIAMIQTLCASGSTPSTTSFSPINTDATTDQQL